MALVFDHDELDALPGTRTGGRRRTVTEPVARKSCGARRSARDIHRARPLLTPQTTATHSSAEVVLIANRDGVVEYANAECAGAVGCPLESVLGRPARVSPRGFVHGQRDHDVGDTVRAVGIYRGTFLRGTDDGDSTHIVATITPLADASGTVTRFVAVVRDGSAPVAADHALHRLNVSLEQQAQRIAHALHDDAAQFVTAAHIAVDEIAEQLPPPLGERLNEVKQHLDAIEGELRRLAHELRPRILDDLGLVAALQFLAGGVERRRGIAVSVAAAVRQRLSPLVETTVYRAIQEALNNAGRHGRAQRIVVTVEDSGQHLSCRIDDDGIGFDAGACTGTADANDSRVAERGFGLDGIRQQIEAIGGTLAIDSAAGLGTRLTILIPLES